MKAWSIIFCLAAVLGIVLTRCRGARLNDWPIVNHPVAAGASVLCFGDSLVTGIGAETDADRYPDQLAVLLGCRVAAVGKPGQTSEEGVEAVRDDPRLRAPVVVVTLGGNDILHQVPWTTTETFLDRIFTELQQRGTMVAFTGVESPLSGTRGKRHRILCRQRGVILIPNILGGIMNNQDLKSDQIHPNGAGYRLMAERVAETLRPFLGTPAPGT